jgi:hypothetical protein
MTGNHRSDWVKQARAALIVAAMRRSILTYGELGKALGMEGVALRNQLRHVLDDLSVDCNAENEPSLAALVVNQEEGRPGQGWIDGAAPWHAEIQRCFRYWTPR